MNKQQQLFVLHQPPQSGAPVAYAVIGSVAGHPAYVTTRCPICGRLISKKRVRNITIELYRTEILDFIWSDGEEVIVSKTARDALMQCGLSGIDFREVNLSAWWAIDSSTNQMVDYSQTHSRPEIFQLIVTGKGGSIFPQSSATITSQCATCGTKVYGLLQDGFRVDLGQWDGSDFFVMNEFPGYILITKNAWSCLQVNRIRNVAVTEAEKFAMG